MERLIIEGMSLGTTNYLDTCKRDIQKDYLDAWKGVIQKGYLHICKRNTQKDHLDTYKRVTPNNFMTTCLLWNLHKRVHWKVTSSLEKTSLVIRRKDN